MTLDNATATINGLTIGSGTSYPWRAWPDGLIGTPSIRTADEPRAGQHGVIAGRDLLASRSVVFDLWCNGSSQSDGESKLATLAAAFAPSESDVTLTVRMSGTPDEYQLTGRCRGITSALNRTWRAGVCAVRAEFRATDPRLYSTTASTASTALSTATGGLEFAATAPFVFGSAGVGNTMSCTNDGTFAAPWVATFTGPLVAPELLHVDTGKRLTFSDCTLAAGETLVIDSTEHTVLLNGTASRYLWLTSASQWFDLAAGANTVMLLGASGAGSVELAWRSAWV